MLEPDRVAYYFTLLHELPEVEFKGPGRRGDNPLLGRVIRAAMAMANRRGGGTVIIRVAEKETHDYFVGKNPVVKKRSGRNAMTARGFPNDAPSVLNMQRLRFDKL